MAFKAKFTPQSRAAVMKRLRELVPEAEAAAAAAQEKAANRILPQAPNLVGVCASPDAERVLIGNGQVGASKETRFDARIHARATLNNAQGDRLRPKTWPSQLPTMPPDPRKDPFCARSSAG